MIDPTRIFPHKTSTDLQLQLTELQVKISSGWVDAKVRPAVTVQANVFALDVDEELAHWSMVKLKARALAPSASLTGLLPKGTDIHSSTTMVVAVLCPSTKLRRRVFLTRNTDKEDEWYGEIELQRNDLRTRVELIPIVARASDFPADAEDDEGTLLATYRGAILAHGEPIVLRVDEPAEKHGALRVRWEDFALSQHQWRRDHPKDMFYVDTSDEKPEVVLNEGHALFKQILMKKRPRGAEASVKASLLAYIAHATWTTLFVAALASTQPAEDEDEDAKPTWPSDEVKAKVLRALLPLVVPERTDDAERLESAVELYRDAGRISSLLTQLNSAIQELIKVEGFVLDTLEKAFEEVM